MDIRKSSTEHEPIELMRSRRFDNYSFFFQMGVICFIVVSSIINLSLGVGPKNIWLLMLSIAVGWILPSPKIKDKFGKELLDNPYFIAAINNSQSSSNPVIIDKTDIQDGRQSV